MADNLIPVVGTSGNPLRTLQDGSNVEWAAGVCAYATTVGSPNVLQVVTPSAGLPVAQQGSWSITVSALPTAGATGSAVPADADYNGLNVAGNLRGQTGVNPSGSIYAAQTDLSSVGGASVALGQATMAASIPVALASNQSALTVAGSGTFTVGGTVTANIGTTNGLALDATVAKLNVGQGTALGSNTGPLIQGSVTTASPAYTTGQISPLSLTTAGALRVDASATTQPVSGTVTANQGGAPWSQNLTQVGGSAVALGSHTSAASVPVVVASDQGAISVAQSGTWNVTVNTALPAGGNQIGHVVVDGLPSIPAGSASIGNVGLNSGTNTIGVVISGNQFGVVFNGTTSVPVQYAVINASSSGANTIITGTAAKKIYVLSFRLNAAGAVNAQFQSQTGPTNISGLYRFSAAGAGQGRSFSPVGHFATTANADNLILNLSAAVEVDGEIAYVVF